MLQPLHDKVIIKPNTRQLSEIIYTNNKEPFNEGTVVAVGPLALDVQVGDFVKYGNGDYLKWPTHKVDGQDYQIIQEADICAIVEFN
jgi:co-chaperonin GroES (HSP10)